MPRDWPSSETARSAQKSGRIQGATKKMQKRCHIQVRTMRMKKGARLFLMPSNDIAVMACA